MAEWQAPAPPGFLRLEQVAARFLVSRTTISNIIADGGLTAVSSGGRTLIHEDELARFVKKQRRLFKEKIAGSKVYDRVGRAIILEDTGAKS